MPAMASSPAVAVVIPAHDAASVIHQTLAGVAAQSVTPREVVVVDDASADDTAQLAAAWADRLPLEVVRLEHNRGPAGARKVAVSRTSAPLVALLDADDFWAPDHLDTMLASWSSHDDLVTADARWWRPGASMSRRSWSQDFPLPSPEDQLRAILRQNFVFVGSLFSRELYDRAGGFREPLRGVEDWDLWIRMIQVGARVRRPAHTTVLYRVTAGSLSDNDLHVEKELGVLDQIEVTTRPAARWLRQARRSRFAIRSLQLAYSAARTRRFAEARCHAAAALRGPPRVAARAVVALVAPRLAAAWRDRRRRDR